MQLGVLGSSHRTVRVVSVMARALRALGSVPWKGAGAEQSVWPGLWGGHLQWVQGEGTSKCHKGGRVLENNIH